MSYVVYRKSDTYAFRDKYGISIKRFATESAAKSAITRAVKKGTVEDRDEWAIAEMVDFIENVEKQVTKKNLMSGGEFSQSRNTPLCCDPSSETYWSM